MKKKSFWKPRKIVGGLLGPLVLLAVFPAPANAYPRPGTTERVSVATGGAEATGHSTLAVFSPDGRYFAFHSDAPNLVPGDTNGRRDVFVRDRVSGTTERVSVATGGAEATGHSQNPSISADGRYVAFSSGASELVPGDTNDLIDIFVRDRVSGTTERVSVATGGAQTTRDDFTEGNSASLSSAIISADGRYVTFHSDAPNLVPGDTNAMWDVFVRDRVAGTTERVSVGPGGAEATGHSRKSALSPDGRYVAFVSIAPNLVPGDTNGRYDAFVRDRVAGTTERVSVGPGGAEASGDSFDPITPAISPDGRYVAFESRASNLVPWDTNTTWDIFVRDRVAGTTERVSVAAGGAEAWGCGLACSLALTSAPNGHSFAPAISADGRYVAFFSNAPNLVPGDTNGRFDAFVRDRVAGTTERVSVATGGAEATLDSRVSAISPDGRYVAFYGDAPNLVPGDTNGRYDVFVRDRGPALGVEDLSVTKVSGELHVSGRATFSGGVVVSATDPAGDGVPGAGPAGAELTGASLTYRPEDEDLLVRLPLVSLPGLDATICRAPPFACMWASAGAGLPGVLYGLRLDLAAEHYEVRALREVTTAEPPAGPLFALYRCELTCTEQARLTGGIGTTGAEVLVSVPLSVLGAQEGVALSGVQAFTALGEATRGTLVMLDQANLPASAIPVRHVSLGIAPKGTPEEEVAFNTEAEIAGGSLAGTLDIGSFSPGDYEVWARACLGDVCGAAARIVTLG